MEDQVFYFYLAGVPVLGMVAQWLAWRFQLPSILLLLGFGVALGVFVTPDELLAELIQGQQSSVPKILFPVVSFCVAIILFEGGLTLKLSELKEAGNVVFRLVSIGVAVSWLLTAIAAVVVVGLDKRMAVLLGAILTVTGPTVIAPMLRHIRPTRKIGSIAKWEGIVIDPVGAVLAVLVFQVIARGEQASVEVVITALTRTIVIGLAFGLGAGWLLAHLAKRFLIPDFLQGVTFLTVALATFAASNALQAESGLLTVTLLGVYLANQKHVSIQHVLEFKEHLVVLLVSCLFIVLGSRLEISEVASLGWRGAGFLALMIIVVRPASVFLATIRSSISIRERLFLACMAPRGIVAAAVTSVFALEVVTHAEHLVAPDQQAYLIGQANQLVPLTFLIIVGTVTFYGLLAGPLARRLRLADSNPQGVLFAGAQPWMHPIAEAVSQEGFQVLLLDTNYRHIATAQMEGLSAECANILSEHSREEIDFGGIGRLLAMTPNDEVNSLAVGEFTHVFGRQNVYQLPPWEAGSGPRRATADHLRGRLLFAEGLHHDKLENLIKHGLQVKKTKLSEEFTFDDFKVNYGDSAIILFMVDENRNLQVCTAGDQPDMKPGQTLIALVDAPDENNLTSDKG